MNVEVQWKTLEFLKQQKWCATP